MSEARRNFKWETQCTDVVGVARALAPIVHAAGRSLPYVKTDGYDISAPSSHLSGVENLEDAASRLPDPVRSVSLNYSFNTTLINVLRNRPVYRIKFKADKSNPLLRFSSDSKVSVNLEMEGPDTDATIGLMERLRTQFETEIARQEGHNWSAPAVGTVDLSRSITAHTQKQGRSSFWTKGRKWLAGFSTALLVTVVGTLLTDWIKRSDDPAQTTSTTTPTPTTPTTTLSPLSPSTTPGTPTATTQPTAATAPTFVTPVPSRTCLAETFMYPPQCIKWSD